MLRIARLLSLILLLAARFGASPARGESPASVPAEVAGSANEIAAADLAAPHGEPAVESAGEADLHGVLLVGWGFPDDSFEFAYGEILQFLRDSGVELANDPDETKPYRMSGASIDYFRGNLAILGVESLLILQVEMEERQQDWMSILCFDPNGGLRWEETVKGTLSMTYRKAVGKLANKMKKKLRDHLGKPGLPLLTAAGKPAAAAPAAGKPAAAAPAAGKPAAGKPAADN